MHSPRPGSIATGRDFLTRGRWISIAGPELPVGDWWSRTAGPGLVVQECPKKLAFARRHIDVRRDDAVAPIAFGAVESCVDDLDHILGFVT